MAEAGYLFDVIVVLLAAVIATLLFRRLGLGTVLGYLIAGVAIGRSGFGLVTAGETLHALAELGVVFLLFTVGLELPLERLKVLIGRIAALGAAQVVVTTLAVAGVALLAGLPGTAAVAVGGGLALSSTAIVLRMLSDRQVLTTVFGRTVFGVLLVQDLAVAPFLVVVLALGERHGAPAAALGPALFKMLVAVLLILGAGRLALRHVFQQVARIREPEIFAALTLFIVLGTGLAAALAGLSMAFGAFLAGMLLAGTHFRHQVAAEIQPFRGLLLGLFFMSVGMHLDLALIKASWPTVLALAVGLLLGKGLIVGLLGRALGLPAGQALHLGLLLAQGGEFTFVLLGAALEAGILPAEQGQLLVAVVTLTMMATPLMARLGRALEGRAERAGIARAEEIPEQSEGLDGHVVIAGFGRVGAAVAQRLRAAGEAYVAVDLDPHRIAQARQRGLPVYYGDATRPEILDAVRIERARAVVVALDNPRAALQVVALLHYIFPELPVYARASDDAHAAELERAGAALVVPELVATGLKLAGSLLERGAPDAGGQ